MTFEPYDYQAADLVKMRKHGYRSLLNMGTGSGKTATSLFAVRDSAPDRTLIVTPAQTIQSAWLPTIQSILGVEGRVIGNTRKADKEALFEFELGDPGVYLCTTEFFTRSDVSTWYGDMLIVDEAHRLGNPGKKGQRNLGGYNRKDNPVAQRFEGRLMLSGTMLRNKFEYAWSHARALWPEYSGPWQLADADFYRWQTHRMEMELITIGMNWVETSETMYSLLAERGEPRKRIDGVPHMGVRKTAREYQGERNPGTWISEAPCVITHLKRERCCEFHPNGYLPVEEPMVVRETISLAPAQKKAIKELDQMMLTYLEDHPMEVKIPLTKAVRIRQCILGVPTLVPTEDNDYTVEFAEDTQSPFYDRLKEFLTDEVPEENVVVYVDSQKFAAVVTQRLNNDGISAFEYSGATTKTRDENAEQFGKKFRVVVGVLQAIAEGYDGLQKVAKTEVWLSRLLDETLNEQAEGRLDRIGQTGQVLRVYFDDDLGISEGRFSEAVEKRLRLNKSLREKELAQ